MLSDASVNDNLNEEYAKYNKDIDNKMKRKTKKENRRNNINDRKKATKDIVNAKSFEEAEKIKNKLLLSGNKPDTELYYELINKCYDYKIIKNITDEMKKYNCIFDEKFYVLLIRKSSNLEEALEWLEIMEMDRMFSSIRAYHCLIAKSRSVEDVIKIYEKMERSYICPDIKIMDLIINRIKDTNLRYNFIYLKYIIQNVMKIISITKTLQELEERLKELNEQGYETNIDLINILIYYSKDHVLVLWIIDLIYSYSIKPNAQTYIFLLKKTKEFGYTKELYGIMQKTIDDLNEENFKEVINWFGINRKHMGGNGKYIIEVEKTIKELGNNIKNEDNIEEILYLASIQTGYDLGIDFENVRKEYLEYLDSLHKEKDSELYKYEIRNIEGVILGIDSAEKLYKQIQSKKYPIKSIAFIEDEEIRKQMEFLHMTSYFYKSTIDNINDLDVNNFNFTSSLKDFQQLIQKADYNKYEVIVTIISNHDSKNFYKSYLDSIEIENIKKLLDDVLQDRLNNIKFLEIDEKKNYNLKDIMGLMCKHNTMKPIIQGNYS